MPDHEAGPDEPSDAGRGDGDPTPPGASRRDVPLGAGWPDELAERIEAVVGAVRDKTTLPITKAARAVVFGLLVVVGGLASLVFLLVALIRLLDVYLPFSPYSRRVWVVYAAFGAIFLVGGAFCWSKRRPRNPSER